METSVFKVIYSLTWSLTSCGWYEFLWRTKPCCNTIRSCVAFFKCKFLTSNWEFFLDMGNLGVFNGSCVYLKYYCCHLTSLAWELNHSFSLCGNNLAIEIESASNSTSCIVEEVIYSILEGKCITLNITNSLLWKLPFFKKGAPSISVSRSACMRW